MQQEKEFKVIVVGGGLVGALAALTFARRGFSIELFEKRPGLTLLMKILELNKLTLVNPST